MKKIDAQCAARNSAKIIQSVLNAEDVLFAANAESLEVVSMVKIIIDKEKCIGCAACTSVCDNFEIKDGKAYAKETEVDEPGCNK